MKIWNRFLSIFKSKTIEDDTVEYDEDCIIMCNIDKEYYILSTTDVYPYLRNLNTKLYIDNMNYQAKEYRNYRDKAVAFFLPKDALIFNNAVEAYQMKEYYEKAFPQILKGNKLIIVRKIKNLENNVNFGILQINAGVVKYLRILHKLNFEIIPESALSNKMYAE